MKWMYFPKNKSVTDDLLQVVSIFEKHKIEIDSEQKNLISNEVLNIVAPDLKNLGYAIEFGKKRKEKVHIPVLYGECGASLLSFDADAYHKNKEIVIEVEAGQAVDNYKFLKDFFEACCMDNTTYLCIAVRKVYGKQKDFEKVCKHFDALYSSNRLSIPLKGILIIGY